MISKLMTLCEHFDFKSLFDKKGYVYFTEGNYNLNIIGIRKYNKQCTNEFEDLLVVIHKNVRGGYVRHIYRITTKPGLTSLQKPVNAKGTAILVPGQYRGAYMLGLHKGKYKALVQRKTVKVYRDNNKNVIYDFDQATIDEGYFGINIHKAGEKSVYVNGWSAGCQVFAARKDFEAFIGLCQAQVDEGLGNSFTYTLIDEFDLV